jgi:hypothetical protein
MKASEFHNLYGDTIALDVFGKLEPLDMSEVISTGFGENCAGKKNVYRYKDIPDYWNIPKECIISKPVRIESNQGSFFLPHKDLRNRYNTNDKIRLNCFLNNTRPEECTYVIGGVIQLFEAGRWYVVNPRKTHYSFTFADNTVHYAVDLMISDEATANWLWNAIEFQSAAPVGNTANNYREGYK